jgi:hypothetical protein
MAVQYLRDCVAMDTEDGRQFSDLASRPVPSQEFLDLVGTQTVLNPSEGSNFGLSWTRGDHFEEVLDAFSLVTEVRITSQHLHRCCRFDSIHRNVRARV